MMILSQLLSKLKVESIFLRTITAQFPESSHLVPKINPPATATATATITSATSTLSKRSDENPRNAEVDEDVTDVLPTMNNPIFWSHEAILLLVRTYQEHKDLFQSPVIKKHEVWRRISTNLAKEGHNYTPMACDKKFRSLKYRYNTISDSNKQSGRGKRAWGYLDLMGEVLEGDPAVTPVATLASIPQVKTANEMQPKTASIGKESQTTPANPSTSCNEAVAPKKKAKKPDVPQWFTEFAKKQEKQLEDLKKIQLESIAVAKERNDILRAFTQAIAHRNEV